MAKDDLIEFEGVVRDVLPDGLYRIGLDNGHDIIAYTAGRMKKFRIRILAGDRVTVEMTPYDLTKGRINFRTRTSVLVPGLPDRVRAARPRASAVDDPRPAPRAHPKDLNDCSGFPLARPRRDDSADRRDLRLHRSDPHSDRRHSAPDGRARPAGPGPDRHRQDRRLLPAHAAPFRGRRHRQAHSQGAAGADPHAHP